MSSRLYIVHGADRSTGATLQRVVEARDSSDASDKAQRLGMLVSGVEVYVEDLTPSADPPSRSQSQEAAEQIVWKGHPSQWSNFGTFVAAVIFFWLLLIPVLVAIYKYLVTKSMRITLTSERLRLEWGVLGKNLEEVELYRVRDTSFRQSIVERTLGLGTVTICTADRSTPMLHLRAIHEPREVREQIRQNAERMRQKRGVRDIDVS